MFRFTLNSDDDPAWDQSDWHDDDTETATHILESTRCCTEKDRIDSASVAAWAAIPNLPQGVSGGVAYRTLRALYFALRRSLSPQAHRITLTRNECLIFFEALSATPNAARTLRTPVTAITAELRRAIAAVPWYSIETLKAAAKKCAVGVAPRGARPRSTAL
jgi:hypothetical protein